MLHQVGVGVLGPVFRTYEPTRDRLVAVKVFRLDITPEAAQELADELARAADAGLFHPSIVEPLAAGIEGTVAYRAEEYVAAESLDVAMRHYSPATIDKALPIITQLAGAIDFARTAGVGHGALHPRDVFVSPDETRVTGFGVVEALERFGLRAPVRRPYSAPERVTGGAWSTPADVFSLAAITYELLTGRRPAGTGAQIGELPDDDAAAPGLHAVLARAMSEAPEDRYQSALEFVSALDAAADAEPVSPPAAQDRAVASPVVLPAEPSSELDFPTETVDVRAASNEEIAFDDIDVERADDEAHMTLASSEQDEESGQDDDALSSGRLFDDEAVEDLAIAHAERDATERFADEFAAVTPINSSGADDDISAHDARPVLRTDDEAFQGRDDTDSDADTQRIGAAPFTTLGLGGGAEDEPGADRSRRYDPVAAPGYAAPVAHDRPALSRLLVWSFLLLIGFAVGYIVRGAVDRPGEGTGSPAAAARAEQPDGAAAGQTPAQPYSEQAVTAPKPASAEPPPVAAETPAVPEPVPAARPATPATGRLVIRSTPPGAAVTIDGTWRGRTPLTLDDISLGSHSVRVVQSGYNVATEDVRLSGTAPSRTLTFRLRRAPAPARAEAPAARAPERPATPAQKYTGTIFVDSRPRGARVLLNGRDMGTTPVRIPEVSIGSHVVRLQLEDHRDWTTSTRVAAGQDVRVTGSLERIR